MVILLNYAITPFKIKFLAARHGLESTKVVRTVEGNDSYRMDTININELSNDELCSLINDLESMILVEEVTCCQVINGDSYYYDTLDNGELEILNASTDKENNKYTYKSTETSTSTSSTTSGKKCGICSDPATQEIADEYYCDEHFKNAVNYYMNLD